MFYEDALRALAQARVKYLVAGGIAVNLHGVPRMTYDLDILLKSNACRKQDVADIESLEVVKKINGKKKSQRT